MTKTRSLTLIFPLLLGLGLASGTAQAKIKCWTNSDGIRECGNAVPPEYAQKGHDEVTGQGRVKHHERARTEEELAEDARLKAIEKEEQRLAEERVAHDRVLLNTFANEDEIIMARDGKLTSLSTEIRLSNNSLNKTQERLDKLRKQAANMERTGKPVPEKLSKDIQHAQNQIKEYNAFIQNRKEEKDSIHQQFDADVKRYRELRPQRLAQ